MSTPRPADARAVANTFLRLAQENGRTLTQLQLQKLVYIAHGWHLAFRDEPLFWQEVLAWPHGPVVRDVFDAFREYGAEPIGRFYESVNPTTFLDEIPFVEDKMDLYTIRLVWDSYGAFGGSALRNMTHEKDAPWDKVYHARPGGVIPNDSIEEHYKELARQRGLNDQYKSEVAENAGATEDA